MKYATWAEVDKATRGQMFKELRSQIHVHDGYTESQAFRAFKSKCGARFREIRCKIRGGYQPPNEDGEDHPDQPDQSTQPGQRKPPTYPSWVQSGLEDALNKYWKTEAFDKVSLRNKNQRSSIEGSSVHTGGSITFHDNTGRQWKLKEVARFPSNQFVNGTRLRDDESKPWLNKKCKRINDAYIEKRTQWCAGSTSLPGCDNEELPKEVEDHLWVDATVGPKRG